MANSETAADTNSTPRSKVARLIDTYDLDGMGDEMEYLWTAEGDDRRSLRDLADYFNKRVLEQELSGTEIKPLDGEVENFLRLLTRDDVNNAEKTRARRRLEREGIDVDRLLDDFVTYQAIRTYLKNHRDATYSPDETDSTEKAKENLIQLRCRTARVTENKINQLARSDSLSMCGNVRATADVKIICEGCGSHWGIEDLLAEGGCSCD